MITAQDMAICEQRAAGQTLEQIATSNGLGHRSVAYRKLSRPELKEIVESIQEDFVSKSVPEAAENIVYAIKAYKDKDSDTQLREHGFKASQRALEMVGILPSHTPSLYVQQIFNHTDVHTSVEVNQLQSFLSSQMSQIIDVEPEDTNP
jgi:hypothetical protein